MSSLAFLPVWGEICWKERQYHSPQHATGSLSKCSINLGAQLVQSSFCRAEISSQALTSDRENRGREGVAEGAHQNSKLSGGTHVLLPLFFSHRAAHLAWVNIKEKFRPGDSNLHVRLSRHLFVLFFSPPFSLSSHPSVGVKVCEI